MGLDTMARFSLSQRGDVVEPEHYPAARDDITWCEKDGE